MDAGVKDGVIPRLEGHLDANEEQQRNNRLLEVHQILGQGSQDEIQAAQAQDGKNHGRIHQQGLLSHGNDSRHRIEGEGDVGRLDGHQAEKSRCCVEEARPRGG